MLVFLINDASADGGASFLQRLWELLGALHPATVHFPIAGIMMAALALALGWKLKGAFDDVAFFCLLVAALAAAAAATMGWALAPQLGYSGLFSTATSSQTTLLLHRWGGTALGLWIVATAIVAVVSRRRGTTARWWKAGVFAGAVLASAVGHWGGSLTYDDLLSKAISRVFSGAEVVPVVQEQPPADGPSRPDGLGSVPDTLEPNPEGTSEPEPPTASSQAQAFERDIRPLLEGSCLSCHGPAKQKSGYRLDTAVQAFAGGELCRSRGEKAVVPGDSQASRLVWMISAEDDDFTRDIYPMPPAAEYHLSPAEIEAVRSWIDSGAFWPEGLVLEAGP